MWQEAVQQQARRERMVQDKLSELAEEQCPYCWGMLHEVFRQEISSNRADQEQAARHRLWDCPSVALIGGIEAIERVRGWVRYKNKVGVCWRCGMAEALCEGARARGEEKEEERKRESNSEGQRCRWSNVVLPALCGLRVAGLARMAAESSRAASETVLGQQGYRETGVYL